MVWTRWACAGCWWERVVALPRHALCSCPLKVVLSSRQMYAMLWELRPRLARSFCTSRHLSVWDQHGCPDAGLTGRVLVRMRTLSQAHLAYHRFDCKTSCCSLSDCSRPPPRPPPFLSTCQDIGLLAHCDARRSVCSDALPVRPHAAKTCSCRWFWLMQGGDQGNPTPAVYAGLLARVLPS